MEQPQTRRQCRRRMRRRRNLLRSADGGDIEKVGTKSAAEPPPPSFPFLLFLSFSFSLSSAPNYKFDAAAGGSRRCLQRTLKYISERIKICSSAAHVALLLLPLGSSLPLARGMSVCVLCGIGNALQETCSDLTLLEGHSKIKQRFCGVEWRVKGREGEGTVRSCGIAA